MGISKIKFSNILSEIATAIAILQLKEKGKLSLNDPVNCYLPIFKVEYPSKTSKQITILNLLNHSSGLPDPSDFTFIRWIHHDGGGPGFRTKIQLYPDENLGFVLFANDDTCEPWELINLTATLKW